MLTSISIKGRAKVLVIGKLYTSKSFAYKGGEKTNEPRRAKNGEILVRLRGAIPVIDGEPVPDGSIFVEKNVPLPAAKMGEILRFQGEARVRPTRGINLTATLEGTVEKMDSFSLPNPTDGEEVENDD